MIDVITANFNYGRFLESCIKSVLIQDYQDWNLWICDDGSTDNSEEVVSKYTDPRIHFLKWRHTGGPAGPRNRGIRASSGAYVAFLDSDDMLTKGSLRRRLSFMQEHDLDYISGQTLNVDTSMTVTGNGLRALVPHMSHGYCRVPTLMVKRSLIDKYGMFDERLLRYEEKEWIIRLLLVPGREVRKACLPDIVAYYRVHADSIVRQQSKRPRSDYEKFVSVVKEYCPEFQFGPPNASLSPMLSKCEWVSQMRVPVLC